MTQAFVVEDHPAGDFHRIEATSLCDAYEQTLGNLGILVMEESEYAEQYPDLYKEMMNEHQQ